MILININNTRNVISNSDTWAGIYNKLYNDFIRIAPHAEEYLNTEQLSVYIEKMGAMLQTVVMPRRYLFGQVSGVLSFVHLCVCFLWPAFFVRVD